MGFLGVCPRTGSGLEKGREPSPERPRGCFVQRFPTPFPVTDPFSSHAAHCAQHTAPPRRRARRSPKGTFIATLANVAQTRISPVLLLTPGGGPHRGLYHRIAERWLTRLIGPTVTVAMDCEPGMLTNLDRVYREIEPLPFSYEAERAAVRPTCSARVDCGR